MTTATVAHWPADRWKDADIWIGTHCVSRRLRRSAARMPGVAAAEFEARWRRGLASKARRAWMADLKSIRGKVLGCDCNRGARCHGEILVRLIGEYCG